MPVVAAIQVVENVNLVKNLHRVNHICPNFVFDKIVDVVRWRCYPVSRIGRDTYIRVKYIRCSNAKTGKFFHFRNDVSAATAIANVANPQFNQFLLDTTIITISGITIAQVCIDAYATDESIRTICLY